MRVINSKLVHCIFAAQSVTDYDMKNFTTGSAAGQSLLIHPSNLLLFCKRFCGVQAFLVLFPLFPFVVLDCVLRFSRMGILCWIQNCELLKVHILVFNIHVIFFVHTQLQYIRYGIQFPVVYFSFYCSNNSSVYAYRVYIFQLILYFRACSYYQDFIKRELLLMRKLLNP